jgi:hypothetical protein
MRKLLILFVLFGYCAFPVFGQGELNEQQKIFFRNERSFAILLNSDGYGLSYREASRVDFLNKRYFEIEAGTLKHPREYRDSNPYYQTPGTFVYGKMNFPLYLRGSYGIQHEIFKKADLGGVAVRYFISGGPSFAVYKPIYYKILYPISDFQFEIKEEKLDVITHPPYDVYGRASFTKGLSELKIVPGLFAKGGFNFEYSKEEKVIHAVEAGISFSAFTRKIPIMATTDNKALYLSLFISYRFGIIIDPLNPESNKFSYIFRRKRVPAIY